MAAIVVLAGLPAYAADTGAVKGTVKGPDGKPLADAAVLVEGPKQPAPPNAPHAVVDQRNQSFVPHVVAVATGTTVDFPNSDDMLHNVYSGSPAKKFDLGMYARGQTRSVTFDTPGVVRIGCNVHPNMEAFVVVHDNPYVAVSGADGTYTVAGVPAGSYQLRVWHDDLPERRLPVTVQAGQVERVDVPLAGPR